MARTSARSKQLAAPPTVREQGTRHVDIIGARILPQHHTGLRPNLTEDTPQARAHTNAQAADSFIRHLPKDGPTSAFRDTLGQLVMPQEQRGAEYEQMVQRSARAADVPNAIAKAFRDNPRHYQTVAPGMGKARDLPTPDELMGAGALVKANLDVGTLTNYAQISGGQALGYTSMDTRIARGTVRPDSFTLYQSLPKSAAFQVVDYWTYIDATGGAPPGAAFQGFSSVGTGTLTTNVGSYTLQNVQLKLAMDGRSVTTALMAQNNFVDVVAQENANAALTVLNSVNWASYWGNPAIFPNQPLGIANAIPATNIYNFQTFFANNASLQGWSASQAIYNMIYEVAAVTTSWGRNGRTTHAFMTPILNGYLQGLVTTVLNNLVNIGGREMQQMAGIVIDGDLQGMRTRMGTIAFPLDTFITARDIPIQGQVFSNGTNQATLTGPTPPTGIAAAVSGAAYAGSQWGVGAGSPYSATGSTGYVYAVASTDSLMNESVLAYSSVVLSGITATGAVVLTIAPPAAADAAAFRVFRSGRGETKVGASGSPTSVRYIGTVLASGSSNVTFVDANAVIPGSETIFLLDMAEADNALDYRFLLPLTKIELFAQNLYMPWAVAQIGSVRVKVPKFHAMITGITVDNPVFNGLTSNT